MARIRSLKPDFFTSEQIVSVSIPARLLFQGIWVFGDDDGYIAASPVQLKMKVFPGDAVEVGPLLDELIEAGLVVPVATDQGDALRVPSFLNHQSPKYPTPTKFSIDGVSLTQHSPKSPPVLPKSSRSVPPGEERRGEEKEEKGNVAEIRPDVSRLCTILADLIEGNGSKRPPINKTWLNAARLLIDTDKRPLGEAIALMKWCQADSFWRANIMSMASFRAKYDTLRLQKDKPDGKKPSNITPQNEWMFR